MADNGLDDLFDVNERDALASVGSAISDVSRSNHWYFSTSFQVDDYTLGQREILHKFGGAYGLNVTEIGLMIRLTDKGFLADHFMRSCYGGGLTSYLSSGELYDNSDLTNMGRAVVDMLVDAVNVRITQHEANAIMHCIGFDSTPSQEGHCNPIRDSFERYLTGKKGYTPGTDQRIIREREQEHEVPA